MNDLSFFRRINLVASSWGNSKTAMAGKSCGWYSPTFACFSTNHIKMTSRWLVFRCWDIQSPRLQRKMALTRVSCLNCNIKITNTSSGLKVITRMEGKYKIDWPDVYLQVKIILMTTHFIIPGGWRWLEVQRCKFKPQRCRRKKIINFKFWNLFRRNHWEEIIDKVWYII